MDNSYFGRDYQFPGDMPHSGFVGIFDFMERNLDNVRTEVAFNDSHRLAGFVVANYSEGFAYLFVTAIASANATGGFAGVSLRAETPWQNRRELTLRLAGEVKKSLDEFFEE